MADIFDDSVDFVVLNGELNASDQRTFRICHTSLLPNDGWQRQTIAIGSVSLTTKEFVAHLLTST